MRSTQFNVYTIIYFESKRGKNMLNEVIDQETKSLLDLECWLRFGVLHS